MTCTQCGRIAGSEDRFCSACGSKLTGDIFQERPPRNFDLNLVLGYIAWVTITGGTLLLITKYLMFRQNFEPGNFPMRSISTINFVISVVDIFLLLIVITLSKAKKIKILFAIFLALKVFMMLSNRIF